MHTCTQTGRQLPDCNISVRRVSVRRVCSWNACVGVLTVCPFACVDEAEAERVLPLPSAPAHCAPALRGQSVPSACCPAVPKGSRAAPRALPPSSQQACACRRVPHGTSSRPTRPQWCRPSRRRTARPTLRARHHPLRRAWARWPAIASGAPCRHSGTVTVWPTRPAQQEAVDNGRLWPRQAPLAGVC